MKRTSITSRRGLQPMVEAVNRRHDSRPSVEFGLMYSAQEPTGEVLMGDGTVTDLSPTDWVFEATPSSHRGKNLRFFSTFPMGKIRCS